MKPKKRSRFDSIDDFKEAQEIDNEMADDSGQDDTC
jgi:hypothetical protein